MQWILMLVVFSNGLVEHAQVDNFTSLSECQEVATSFNKVLQEKGYSQSSTYCQRSQ